MCTDILYDDAPRAVQEVKCVLRNFKVCNKILLHWSHKKVTLMHKRVYRSKSVFTEYIKIYVIFL